MELVDTLAVDVAVDGGVLLGVADGDAPFDRVALGVTDPEGVTGTENCIFSAAAARVTWAGVKA